MAGIVVDARSNNCCTARRPSSERLLIAIGLSPAQCLAVAVAAATATAWAPAASAAPLTISPAPGTPDASPQTGISILGVPARRIASVRVVGAWSGRHPGRLRAFSAHRGAIFVPDAPFFEGERARAEVRVRGHRLVRRRFRIARLGATPPLIPLATTQPDKLQRFVSEPELAPPRITVLKAAPTLPGDIFLTPLPSPVVHPGSAQTVTLSPVGPGGPMIVDGRGRLVWFRQLARPSVAANLGSSATAAGAC